MTQSPCPPDLLRTTIAHATAIAECEDEALDKTIDAALSATGTVLQTDRCYIFQLNLEQGLLWSSHEWCAPGVEAQMDRFPAQPIADFEAFVRPMRDGSALVIDDVDEIKPQANFAQAALGAKGVRALMLVPVGSPIQLVVGLDMVRSPRIWEGHAERMLRILACSLLARLRDRERLTATSQRLNDLERMLEALPDAFYLTDLSTSKIRYANAQYGRIYGRPLTELTQDAESWMRAVHPDDRDRLYLDEERREQTPVDNKYRVLLPDGNERKVWHRGVPIRDGLGNTTMVCGSIRDISVFTPDLADDPPSGEVRSLRRTMGRLISENHELARVRRALESSAALFRLLAEQAESAVFLIQEGRIRYANPAALRACGRAAHTIHEVPLADILGAREAIRILRTVHEGYRASLQISRPDGQERYLDAAVQPVEIDETEAVLITGIDVSDRLSQERRATVELEEMTRLARGNLLSQLYAGLAHELNQPLTSIIAYGYGATRKLQRSGVDPDIVGIVQRMADQAERAGAIVRQLRALFERQESAERPLCMGQLADRTTGLMAHELDRHDVELRLHVAQNLPKVLGDQAQLEVALLNLVRNAMEALEPAPAPRWIRVTVQARGSDIVTEVADPGRPIPTEHRSQLFESFFTTRRGGTGTGLYMARRIAERHRGTLNLLPDAHLKRFVLRLPRHYPALEGP